GSKTDICSATVAEACQGIAEDRESYDRGFFFAFSGGGSASRARRAARRVAMRRIAASCFSRYSRIAFALSASLCLSAIHASPELLCAGLNPRGEVGVLRQFSRKIPRRS